MRKIFICALAATALTSCDPATTNSILQGAGNVLNGNGTASNPLTNDEAIGGLREALSVGATNSGGLASKADGYLKNPRLFIPFPPSAQKVKDKLVALGMEGKVNEFETSLNRAAEEAAKDAAPIFINAIKNMSLSDGFAILKGGDTAATHFLREKTYEALITSFKPTVKTAIEKVQVTKYWNPLITKYNSIPFIEKQNPDLEDYVTRRAASGLFLLVQDEEAKIRKDPMARVSDILKRVFGSPEAQGK